MASLGLEDAVAIIDEALARGRQRQLGRLAAVVVDPGGHLIAVKREDGAEFLRPLIAYKKAHGAVGMGLPTRVMAARADAFPHFFSTMASMTEGGVVPVPGGVIIRDSTGEVVGALGVSGDTSPNDEEVAVEAIGAIGYQPDYGQNEDWNRP